MPPTQILCRAGRKAHRAPERGRGHRRVYHRRTGCRLYNTDQNVNDREDISHYTNRWTNIDDMKLFFTRGSVPQETKHTSWNILGSVGAVFPGGNALDTQFFTPANGTLPGSDQPAELESAAYMDETPRPDYVTPRMNVSAPGYAAGLTPYDFGGSVDFWTTNLYLRYHRTSPADRGWNSFGYIATDADPLPSWSEGALGLLERGRGHRRVYHRRTGCRAAVQHRPKRR